MRAVAWVALPRAGANARGMESEREGATLAREGRPRASARANARGGAMGGRRSERREVEVQNKRETTRTPRGTDTTARGDREDGRREHKGGDANVDALKSAGAVARSGGTPRCRRRRNDRDEISRRATRDRRGSRDRYFNGYLAKRTSPPTIALSDGGPRVGAYIFVTRGANVSRAATSS